MAAVALSSKSPASVARTEQFAAQMKAADGVKAFKDAYAAAAASQAADPKNAPHVRRVIARAKHVWEKQAYTTFPKLQPLVQIYGRKALAQAWSKDHAVTIKDIEVAFDARPECLDVRVSAQLAPILAEAAALRRLSGIPGQRHVVHLHAVALSASRRKKALRVHLVLDKSEVSLQQKAKGRQLLEPEVRRIMKAAAEDLRFCHQQGVIHGNVSLDAITLSGGFWRLTDFSKAAFYEGRPVPRPASSRHALTGRELYYHHNHGVDPSYDRVLWGDVLAEVMKERATNPECSDLIKILHSNNPRECPSWETILNHSWFRSTSPH